MQRRNYIAEIYKAGDAGMDIFAAENTIIRPGETVIIPTGIKMALPEGYEIQIRQEAGFPIIHF